MSPENMTNNRFGNATDPNSGAGNPGSGAPDQSGRIAITDVGQQEVHRLDFLECREEIAGRVVDEILRQTT